MKFGFNVVVYSISGERSPTQRKSLGSPHKTISTECIQLLIEKYKSCNNRPSMAANYLSVWRQFIRFLAHLDVNPKLWEDRPMLFGAALIDTSIQLSTLKSYISAIKGLLVDDSYPWDDNKMLLRTLSRACRIINDKIKICLPIHLNLLNLLLLEIEQLFSKHWYLEILYKTLFIIVYYGLFRVGELTLGQHTVWAKNVHIGINKEKILFMLYTSKMHGLWS